LRVEERHAGGVADHAATGAAWSASSSWNAAMSRCS
jgi:hypothetical protein